MPFSISAPPSFRPPSPGPQPSAPRPPPASACFSVSACAPSGCVSSPRLCSSLPRRILLSRPRRARARPLVAVPVSLPPSHPRPRPRPPVPQCRTAGAQCIALAPSIGGPPPGEIKPAAPAPPVPLAETSALGKDARPLGPRRCLQLSAEGSFPGDRSWRQRGTRPRRPGRLHCSPRGSATHALRPDLAPGSVPAGGRGGVGAPRWPLFTRQRRQRSRSPERRRSPCSGDLGTARSSAGLGQGRQYWRLVGCSHWGCPGDGAGDRESVRSGGPSPPRPHPESVQRCPPGVRTLGCDAGAHFPSPSHLSPPVLPWFRQGPPGWGRGCESGP